MWRFVASLRGECQVLLLLLGLTGSAVSLGAPPFEVSSPDMPSGQQIPESMVGNVFSCRGGNESPTLEWKNVPPTTKSFAVTMFDPESPLSAGWWHWIAYDIPGTATGLARNASRSMPAGAKQGRPDGDAPEPHYYGPCPARGDTHRYVFTVYALSVDRLDVPSTATATSIEYAISTQTLAKATIERLYSRPKAEK